MLSVFRHRPNDDLYRRPLLCPNGGSDAVVADAVFGVLLAVGIQDVVERDLRRQFADAVVEFRPDGAGGTQRRALALFDGLRETEKAAEADSCFQIFPRLWMI